MKSFDKWSNSLIILAAIIFLWINLSNPIADFFEHSLKLIILQLIFPIATLILLNAGIYDYGLNLKNSKLIEYYTIIFVLISLPLMIWSSRLVEFRNYYPVWSLASESVSSFILFEITVGLSLLSTEFFYRGFLLRPFEKFGVLSIIPQLIPYVLVHIGKPTLEVYVSIFAGLAFGYMAYKTKSIIPSFLSHWIVSVLFDILVLA